MKSLSAAFLLQQAEALVCGQHVVMLTSARKHAIALPAVAAMPHHDLVYDTVGRAVDDAYRSRRRTVA